MKILASSLSLKDKKNILKPKFGYAFNGVVTALNCIPDVDYYDGDDGAGEYISVCYNGDAAKLMKDVVSILNEAGVEVKKTGRNTVSYSTEFSSGYVNLGFGDDDDDYDDCNCFITVQQVE